MIPSANLYLITFLSLISAVFFGGLGSSFLSIERLNPLKEQNDSGLSRLIINLFVSKPGLFVTSLFCGYLLSLSFFILAFTGLTDPLFGISSRLLQLFIQFLIAFLIISFTVILFRQTVFRVYPESALKILAIPALLFFLVLFVFSFLILNLSRILSRIFLSAKDANGKEDFYHRFILPEFYSPFSINDTVGDNSSTEEPEVKIFQNALEFTKLKIRDCMVPRNEIEALEVNSSIAELREKFITSGYSKILIYEDTIDNMIGYISSKELFKNPDNIKSRLVSLSIVPESMHTSNLLHQLIKERRSIALVVDEYGGTSGIVTLEDIMEEIFGEIEDEHDTPEFVERRINENEFIFSGRLEIDYLNEEYNLNIPETEDYDTLAGYIIYNYADIPKLNTNVIIGNLHLRILKVTQTRIELVFLRRNNSEE